MKVVSNSSPLMALAVIDRLSLIRQKFGEIVVPDAVWQESVVAGQHKQGAVYSTGRLDSRRSHSESVVGPNRCGEYGVTIMGTIGLLIWAKQAGLIPSLQDELQKLMQQANFRRGRA